MSSSNPSPTPSPTPSQRSFLPQAWRRRNLSLGLLLIFVLSLWLRFWQLNRLNTLIFDEIYFADHGFSYLKQLDLFDVHPPLGKYFLALGIWLHAHLFGGAEVFRAAREVGDLDAIAYRWLNAFTGSLIPLLVGAIAYQWTHRDRLTLLAAGFTALDGLLLVESRLSLINVYLLFFGLLGLWCFGQAIAQNMAFKWLIAAGLFWGASASVKWNGLGFWLGFFILYSLAWILEELQQWRPPKPKPDKHKYEDSDV
ncbi:phospholipid carrier-dependent glycosyltransferase, partial [Geitlerinema sp. P-1104]|uniref:phospholipid carrier-dependent glycosyltransferase n=1 Tax=Geitlerinema sp. P-1104 TaxID=2546230 RepID=UPI0014770D39